MRALDPSARLARPQRQPRFAPGEQRPRRAQGRRPHQHLGEAVEFRGSDAVRRGPVGERGQRRGARGADAEDRGGGNSRCGGSRRRRRRRSNVAVAVAVAVVVAASSSSPCSSQDAGRDKGPRELRAPPAVEGAPGALQTPSGRRGAEAREGVEVGVAIVVAMRSRGGGSVRGSSGSSSSLRFAALFPFIQIRSGHLCSSSSSSLLVELVLFFFLEERKWRAKARKEKKGEKKRGYPFASAGGQVFLFSFLFSLSLILSLSPYQQVDPCRARGFSAGEGRSAAGCLPCGAPGRYPLKEGLNVFCFVFFQGPRGA